MARAVNLGDERLLSLFVSWFKKTRGREPTGDEIKEKLPDWKAGFMEGWDYCVSKSEDDWPD